MTATSGPAPAIAARIVPVDQVSGVQRQSLFALYQGLFDGARETVFLKDLSDKDQVLLIEDRGILVGFSTMKHIIHSHEGHRVDIFFSGDTVVVPSARASMAGIRLWLQTALASLQANPGIPLYWLLLAGSYRTYRALPLFFRAFYPRDGVGMPEGCRRLHESIVARMFGRTYDGVTGTVRADGAPVLRPAPTEHRENAPRDPHVRFFLRANPGYLEGSELACLAEISFENLSRAGERILRNG